MSIAFICFVFKQMHGKIGESIYYLNIVLVLFNTFCTKD